MFSTMLKEAFVKVEELAASSSSLETVAGRVDGLSDSPLLCVRLVSRVHCGGWTGWSHHENPTVLPALYACQPSPFPWEGFHCPLSLSSPSSPFQIRRLECYTDQGKIINCPFVLAAISTGENKLMVMKPYRAVQTVGVMWFAFQCCAAVQPRLPAASWGLQPADGDPAHSNAQVLLLLQTLHSSTCSTCWLIIRVDVERANTVTLIGFILSVVFQFYSPSNRSSHPALFTARSLQGRSQDFRNT